MLHFNSLFPELVFYFGHGRFIVNNDSESVVHGAFQIIYFPESIVIKSNDKNFLKLDTGMVVSLVGNIDDGRQIQCENIYITCLKNISSVKENIEIIMSPHSNIVIGNFIENQFSSSRFNLIHYSFGDIDFKWKEWNVKIKNKDDVEHINFLSKNWHIPLEKAYLSLESSVEHDHDTVIQFAETICKIVSLSTCQNVIFDRSVFYNQDSSIEIWQA